MRKVIVEIQPSEQAKRAMEYIWEKIEYINLLELLKFDFEKRSKLTLTEIKIREGYRLEEDVIPLGVEILHVLKVDENKYTCLCKTRVSNESLGSMLKYMSPEVMAKLMKVPLSEVAGKDMTDVLEGLDLDALMQTVKQDYDLDVIWTTPNFMSRDKIIHSCIGDQENIKRYLEMMKIAGEILNISFQRPTYNPHDLLTVLTDKQREVVIAAKQHGYYDYPKKVNSEQLANKVGLSRSTMIEHLRKAEMRLMGTILAGY